MDALVFLISTPRRDRREGPLDAAQRLLLADPERGAMPGAS